MLLDAVSLRLQLAPAAGWRAIASTSIGHSSCFTRVHAICMQDTRYTVYASAYALDDGNINRLPIRVISQLTGPPCQVGGNGAPERNRRPAENEGCGKREK